MTHFAQAIEEVAESLPRDITDLDTIIVNETLVSINKVKQFEIRPSYLFTGLQWLLKNNHLYKNVKKDINSSKNISINSIIIDGLKQFKNQSKNTLTNMEAEKITQTIDYASNNSTNNQEQLINHNFIPINEKYGILQSDYHQGMSIFSEQTRGTQCGGIVAYAIAASHTLRISEWNKDIINDIILSGDQYYSDCLDRIDHIHPFNKFLTIDEILGNININNNQFNLHYRDNDLLNSSRNGRLEIASLTNHFNEFLAINCPHLILITNDYTYGIFKLDNKLYLFDSHSKTFTGRRSDIGKASLMVFNSPNSANNLAVYLTKLFNRGTLFSITYISVSVNDVSQRILGTNFIMGSPIEIVRKSSKKIKNHCLINNLLIIQN